MATDVLSLFTSPEQYGLAQDAQRQQQAALFASMSPIQQVNYQSYLGGARTGAALPMLFGTEDPQLRMITQRQALTSSLDTSNPESIMAVARQAAELGDPQFALALTDYANRQMGELAQVQQRQAAATASMAQAGRERTQAISAGIQEAQYVAQLQDQKNELQFLPKTPERERAIAMIDSQLKAMGPTERPEALTEAYRNARTAALLKGAEGTLEYTKEFERKFTELTTKAEKEPTYGVDREAISLQDFDLPYAKLTKEQKTQVNAKLEAERGRIAEKGAPKLPGESKEGPKDIAAFRDKVIGTIDPFRKTVTAADSALEALELAPTNFAAWRAAQTQFARAISGAGDLSQKELAAAGADPSILGGTADYISRLFTSVPTGDTQRKVQATLRALRKVAADKAQKEIDQQKKIARRAKYAQEDIDLIFDFPEFGGGKTVDFKDLKK